MSERMKGGQALWRRHLLIVKRSCAQLTSFHLKSRSVLHSRFFNAWAVTCHHYPNNRVGGRWWGSPLMGSLPLAMSKSLNGWMSIGQKSMAIQDEWFMDS